jgi:hypothetical protein
VRVKALVHQLTSHGCWMGKHFLFPGLLFFLFFFFDIHIRCPGTRDPVTVFHAGNRYLNREVFPEDGVTSRSILEFTANISHHRNLMTCKAENSRIPNSTLTHAVPLDLSCEQSDSRSQIRR